MSEQPLHVFIAQLPAGEDAYDVARRDPTLLQKIIDEARPWYEHRFHTVESDLQDTPEDRALAFRFLLPVTNALHEPVLRAHYSRRLARLTQVSLETVMHELGDGAPPRDVQKGWFS